MKKTPPNVMARSLLCLTMMNLIDPRLFLTHVVRPFLDGIHEIGKAAIQRSPTNPFTNKSVAEVLSSAEGKVLMPIVKDNSCFWRSLIILLALRSMHVLRDELTKVDTQSFVLFLRVVSQYERWNIGVDGEYARATTDALTELLESFKKLVFDNGVSAFSAEWPAADVAVPFLTQVGLDLIVVCTQSLTESRESLSPGCQPVVVVSSTSTSSFTAILTFENDNHFTFPFVVEVRRCFLVFAFIVLRHAAAA